MMSTEVMVAPVVVEDTLSAAQRLRAVLHRQVAAEHYMLILAVEMEVLILRRFRAVVAEVLDRQEALQRTLRIPVLAEMDSHSHCRMQRLTEVGAEVVLQTLPV